MTNADTLAAVINAECGKCSLTEQYLVGSTVLNRMVHGEFPLSLESVIYQTNQYQGVGGKQFHPTPKTRKVAKDLLRGLYVTPNIHYFCLKGSTRPMKTITIVAEHHYYGN
jgi:spore germination cell wall hydrolase CwlJ-like protein